MRNSIKNFQRFFLFARNNYTITSIYCNKYFSNESLPSGSSSFANNNEITNDDFDEVNKKGQTGKEFMPGKFTLYMSSERSYCTPENTNVVLFPGQGSQFVGMGKRLLGIVPVREMFDKASEILKIDLTKLCLEGPESDLEKTVNQQPAIFVVSLAAAEYLKYSDPKFMENCVAAAGFSLGEYTALTFAGVFSFEQALRLIQLRAQLMQDACTRVNSGLASILIKPNTPLKLLTDAMHAAREYCKQNLGMTTSSPHYTKMTELTAGGGDPVCCYSAHLFPYGKVLGGHQEALDFMEEHHREFGILRWKRLAVSGAFHTPLMQSAQKRLSAALEAAPMGEARFPVLSNVDALPIGRGRTRTTRMLAKQLVNSVKWDQSMVRLLVRPSQVPFPRIYELGPGRQLSTILKQSNRRALSAITCVEV